MKKYLKGFLEIKKGADFDFNVIASTADVDRDQEVIDQKGWNIKNFLKNPIILWAHNYNELPIGKATNIRATDNGLEMAGVFASKEANPKAEQVKRLYEEGILKTVSVGFIPKEREGNIITEAELLELSFVPVPANPNALSLAYAKGIKLDEDVKETIKHWEDEESDVDGDEKDNILPPDGENGGDDIEGELYEDEEKSEEDVALKASLITLQEEAREVQTIILDKKTFGTIQEAEAWAKANNFKHDKVDETDTSWRFRQFEPTECMEDSFKTIELTAGVGAVVCRREDGKSCKECEKLQDVLNTINELKTDIAVLQKQLASAPLVGGNTDTLGESERSEREKGVVEVSEEILKELLTRSRLADKSNELTISVIKEILHSSKKAK